MTREAAEDRALDRRLKDGDEHALAELFERHRERLWRMVNFRLDRRLHGRVDPDDVLQEGYLAAVKRLAHYGAMRGNEESGAGTPFLWLRLIVNQTMVDVHRTHLGARMRDADRDVALEGAGAFQATSVSLAIQLVGQLTSPSLAAVRAEMSERLQQAIAAMEPIDQEILALRHFEELDNIEVARVLGIQQKAASIRYVRAIRRLKEILARIPEFTLGGGDG